MSKAKSPLRNLFNIFIIIAAVALIIYFAARDINTFGNVVLVMLGFGAVIMIHEFGHFITAKLSGIKVEAFSIGFPPTLLGIGKFKNRMRIRFLPGGSDDNPEDCGTEYRIGLIPFGGFVKMLGQEDTGAVEKSDDPASFLNKPIIVRIAVVAAGVVFNAISAVLIFMTIFLIGVDLPPAVVGSVRPGSPAEIAGLRPKDRIVEVQGETFVDFTALPLAAALSGKAEPINIVVRHPDGSQEQMEIVAQDSEGIPMRSIGITQAETLKIARPANPRQSQQLYDLTGLRGGDVVKALNGQNVSDSWGLRELIGQSFQPEAVFTVERTEQQTDTKELIDVRVPLYVSHANDNFKGGYELAHIHSIVPRLKILSVPDKTKPKSKFKQLISLVREKILKRPPPPENPFEVDDIIVKAGTIENPTFSELRQITTEFDGKPMPVVVLRKNESVELTAFPLSHGNSERVTIGIVTTLDIENPIVAKTIDIENGPAALEIPSGAVITGVDGEDVADFYDVMRIIRASRGQRINLEYRLDRDNAGAVVLDIPSRYDYIAAQIDFAAPVSDAYLPTAAVLFEYLTEIYEADGPVEAVKMGLKKTYMFIAQTYVTLRRLISRDVSPKTLVGPVGIVTLSYKIASSQSLTYYVYFLGLISSVIAVMNLLPLPIVDGGVIVLLIIEKIKGSPVSVKAQEIISYAGLVLIISLFLWLTYNDVSNMWF